MELEGGVGWMEGSTLVICATSLTPHEVRAAVARGLGVGEESVRIETPRMGGSFGKYLIPGIEVHLALLVRKTGRPVRFFLERDEILVRRPKRHPFWGRYRLGVRRDGTFLALDADVIAEAGAYVSLTPAVAAVFADEANGAYEIPHLQVRARGVLTNNPPAALPRIGARALRLDRLPDYEVCQLMIDDPSGTLLGRGQGTHSLARRAFRTIERFQKLQATLATALTSRLRPERLTLVLRLIAWPVNLLNGLVAGVKSRLFPLSVDSYSPRTSGSRGMLMAGQAVTLAASKLHDRALRMAAQALRVPTSNLVLDGNGVHDNAVPDRRLSWAEIAARAGGRLAAVGEARLPYGYIVSPKTGNQLGCIDHMYASHGCDIAINPATGEVSVLRFVACHDVGKALDPEIIRGQIIGSICMGVGQTLWEHIPVHDGRVDISGLHDYRVATSLDAPVDVDVRIVESGAGFGPLGAKGVGEAGAVAAPIAIANAIYDALGVQIGTITCTPEDIACLLQARAAHAAGASA
jgi:CO/xanthine dehydrogenase Mo-binding subunit